MLALVPIQAAEGVVNVEVGGAVITTFCVSVPGVQPAALGVTVRVTG